VGKRMERGNNGLTEAVCYSRAASNLKHRAGEEHGSNGYRVNDSSKHSLPKKAGFSSLCLDLCLSLASQHPPTIVIQHHIRKHEDKNEAKNPTRDSLTIIPFDCANEECGRTVDIVVKWAGMIKERSELEEGRGVGVSDVCLWSTPKTTIESVSSLVG
jgi:hypothetical protein